MSDVGVFVQMEMLTSTKRKGEFYYCPFRVSVNFLWECSPRVPHSYSGLLHAFSVFGSGSEDPSLPGVATVALSHRPLPRSFRLDVVGGPHPTLPLPCRASSFDRGGRSAPPRSFHGPGRDR